MCENLKHYGVKGMKWGVTRDNNDNSSEESSAAGGGGEPDEEYLESILDSLESKMEDIGDDAIELGKGIVNKFYGLFSSGWHRDREFEKELKKGLEKPPKKDPLTKKLESEGWVEMKGSSKEDLKKEGWKVSVKTDKEIADLIKKKKFKEVKDW